jgi:hypothetical protein
LVGPRSRSVRFTGARLPRVDLGIGTEENELV